MKKWNGRESDYEKAERKESEMGIYEERLQEVSIYGERSSEISSGRSCHLRSSRLSVLSEPAGTAVYASPAGTFSENTEKEMNEFLDGLKALENQIDVIKSMQVGKNIDECCCRSYGRQ